MNIVFVTNELIGSNLYKHQVNKINMKELKVLQDYGPVDGSKTHYINNDYLRP